MSLESEQQSLLWCRHKSVANCYREETSFSTRLTPILRLRFRLGRFAEKEYEKEKGKHDDVA